MKTQAQILSIVPEPTDTPHHNAVATDATITRLT